MRVRAFAIVLVALVACTCESEPRTAIPEIDVRLATEAPVLDGILDESAWSTAAVTDRFVNTMDGSQAEPETHARFAYDDEHLYVAFEVADPFLKCTFEQNDDHLWEQDAVELMIDPDEDGQNYFELQVSPTGLVFDTRFDTRRRPQPFGHMGWHSGLRSGVKLDGTVNDEESDRGYTVELAIPFDSFVDTPAPSDGTTWRVALYVLDAREQGQAGVGWSAPLVGDYHVPERFGRINFRR